MQISLGHGGGLDYLEIARPGAPPDLPLIVVLHGRGASAEDLAPIAGEILGEDYRWIFPNGRLQMDLGGWVGYAWYGFEQVARDLPASRAAVEALLAEVWERTGLDAARTVLAGFSQGAVVTLDVGLRAARRFAGLVAMSGYLAEDAALPEALARARDQRVLIVHGTEDPVLPVARGRAARLALESAGLTPVYHEFEMGHEVSGASLATVEAFIREVLPPGLCAFSLTPQGERPMHVYETGDLAPVPTRPGIAARSLAGPKHGITAFFVQENQLDDGATIPMHHHPIDEVVIVTAGELTVETDTTTRTIGPGHVVVLPPGTPHRLSNRGTTPVTMLAAAAWNHATFYREASTYLEGEPRQ